MAPRVCCLCGARRNLVRYRSAEIRGGPAQWVCVDYSECNRRASAFV